MNEYIISLRRTGTGWHAAILKTKGKPIETTKGTIADALEALAKKL